MKNLTKTYLAVILLLLSALPPALAADNALNYKVTTRWDEISIDHMVNGDQYRLADGDCLAIEGSPEIPYKIVRLALPPNTKAVGIVANGTSIRNMAHGVSLTWFEGEIKTDIEEQYSPAPQNARAYSSDDFMPGRYAEIISQGQMGSQGIATVAVYPIQYKPLSGDITLVGTINLSLQLQNNPIPISNNNPVGIELLSDIVDNPDQVVPCGPDAPSLGPVPGGTVLGIGAEYLVITSGELAPAFYPFVFWKNQKGILTELVLIEDILPRYEGEDDAARLREYLKDAYADGAHWILLGGDEDIIPIRYAYPGNVSSPPILKKQQVTDVYYEDLTGDWDVDGDGIYGETSNDSPDIYPEVYVGRIPAESPEDVSNWVGKAIMYEQNPNDGDYAYLTKGLFITADQMRDLNEHTALAGQMPSNFDVDYSRLAEEPSGGSSAPTQPTGETVRDVMDEGWGFVSNLNHGGFYYYAAMTPGYNQNPRSNFYGDTLYFDDNADCLAHLSPSHKYGVHYSISCYTAAYDFDKEVFWAGPFLSNNTFMEAYLFLPEKGGVAFLGNTRWGWVSSSYQLEMKFLEYVFQDTVRYLSVAETMSKLYYPYKTDIGYGHNLFGDPEMKIWANTPTPLSMSAPAEIPIDTSYITITVSDNSGPAANTKVTVWKPGELYYRDVTNGDGELTVALNLTSPGEIYVTAIAQDYIPAIDTIVAHSQSAIGDDDNSLPKVTSLANNYPNPFNVSTAIAFSLAHDSYVTLDIYDIGGRKVKTLANSQYESGEHSVTWNGRADSGDEIASGTYFYRLHTDDKNIIKKMVLLK